MYVFVSELRERKKEIKGERKREIKGERKRKWMIDWLNEGTNELMPGRTYQWRLKIYLPLLPFIAYALPETWVALPI